MKLKNTLTNTIAILLALNLLTACGDLFDKSSMDSGGEETSAQAPAVESEPVEEEPIDHGYELDEYSFHSKVNLTGDFYVSAKEVYITQSSEIKINNYTLTIEAETVHFGDESSLIAFYPREYNSCRRDGKNAGSIEIIADKITGTTSVDLAGQNAGQMSFYLVSDAGNRPVHSSHKKTSSGNYYNGCFERVSGVPGDVPHLLVPKRGGNEGRLKLDVLDNEEFYPNISSRVSHSSYGYRLEGRRGTLSWWRDVDRGPNGRPGKLCYLVNDEYLCR